MKILATGMGWFGTRPGGLNHYFADYLKAMTDMGHTVEGLLSAEGPLDGAPPYITDVAGGAVRLDPYRRMKAFSETVRRRVADVAPDVFNPHFALYAFLITRNMLPDRVPIVTHFHGPWAYESRVEDSAGPLVRYVRFRVKRSIERMTYRRSDAFIVLSQYFRDMLSDCFGIPKERIHVVPGAVDTERFRPAENREALRAELGVGGCKVLFCVRRLVRRMGIGNLIRAFASVVREHPEARLFVAGSGPLKEELEELIGRLGLGGHVRLLGRVSDEELVRWYQAADFSIVPSVDLEGFGLVTVESLACGTPVLGTPRGGTKEILAGFSPGFLFDDATPEAMAGKLLDVLEGRIIAPDREACRRHVLRHYTWAHAARAITAIFEQAIEQRKERAKA